MNDYSEIPCTYCEKVATMRDPDTGVPIELGCLLLLEDGVDLKPVNRE